MKANFLRVLFCCAVLALAGCGSMQLIEPNGRAHAGKFDSMTKKIEITIDGKAFAGFYITNAFAIPITTTGMVGTKIVQTQTLATNPGSNGRALLRASDGSVIECEFGYQGMNAIGSCVSNAGTTYRLMTQ